MPPWLAEPLPSIKTEAIRLYSMDPDVLRVLTVDYSQIVLKALGVRRAPFVAMPLFLPRQRTPAGGGGPNPSLACAGSKGRGQKPGKRYGEAAV
jgi:hypothetical protein